MSEARVSVTFRLLEIQRGGSVIIELESPTDVPEAHRIVRMKPGDRTTVLIPIVLRPGPGMMQ